MKTGLMSYFLFSFFTIFSAIGSAENDSWLSVSFNETVVLKIDATNRPQLGICEEIVKDYQSYWNFRFYGTKGKQFKITTVKKIEQTSSWTEKTTFPTEGMKIGEVLNTQEGLPSDLTSSYYSSKESCTNVRNELNQNLSFSSPLGTETIRSFTNVDEYKQFQRSPE